MKQEIRISTNDGLAPRYDSPSGVTYFISDENVYGTRRYVYTLKAITKPSYATLFEDPASVDAYIKEHTANRRLEIVRYTDETAYYMSSKIFVVTGLTVRTLFTPDIISGPYDSYHACLEFAKTWIADKLKEEESLGCTNNTADKHGRRMEDNED